MTATEIKCKVPVDSTSSKAILEAGDNIIKVNLIYNSKVRFGA